MIGRAHDNLEEILSVILVAALCVVVTLQVFCRLVLGQPLSWTEELAVILFVWITMIGSSLALKRGEHFAVELLHKRLSATDRRLAGMLLGALLIVFSLILLVEGWGMVMRNVRVITPAMEIPRSVPYAALPAGGLLMLVRSVQILVRNARGPGPPSPPDEAAGEPALADSRPEGGR